MGLFDKIFKKKETQRSIPERQVEQEKTIEQKNCTENGSCNKRTNQKGIYWYI